MIRPFILSLQTASVAGGAQGYKTSRAIPAMVRLDSVFLDCSAADADVYAMIGACPGDVASFAAAQNALQLFDRQGDNDTTVTRSCVPLASGSMPVVGIGLILTAPLNRLYLGVINESASAVKVTALFQGVYLAGLEDFESDYLTQEGFNLGTFQLPQAGQIGGPAASGFAALSGNTAAQAASGSASALGWADLAQAIAQGKTEESQRLLRLLQRQTQTGAAVSRTPAPPPP